VKDRPTVLGNAEDSHEETSVESMEEEGLEPVSYEFMSGRDIAFQHLKTNSEITADPQKMESFFNRGKRLVVSARSTSGLQDIGITDTADKIVDKVIAEPKVFGLPHHYQLFNVWGATSAFHHGQLGTKLVTNDSLDMKPSRFGDIYKITTKIPRKRKAQAGREEGYRINLSKYQHTVRLCDKPVWPKTNKKQVVSVMSAAVMITSHPVVDLLIASGCLPIIKHPKVCLGKGEMTFLDIAFGPHLNPQGHQPYPPGRRFPASATYSRYGMKLHNGHNEAWRAKPSSASGIFLRLPEKNGLPLTMPREDRLSPIAEMKRIESGKPRIGFTFFRSGGNCTLKGQAPPAEAARSAGEGAYFEHTQSIRNPHNFAMEVLVEQGTPVTVWGAGDLFPAALHDLELAASTSGAEQVFYFGCYKVEATAMFKANTHQELLSIMVEYEEIYPQLLYNNLRFRLKSHQGYRLVPVEYPPMINGYHYLEIDARDNRRPMFDVPAKQSFEKAFGPSNPIQFDETTMLTAWFNGGGINGYRHKKYVQKPGSRKKSDQLEEWDVGHGLDESESAFRLLEPEDGAIGKTYQLAEFDTRCRTLAQQWKLVVECAVASFLRLLEVNMDSSGKVGPLMDASSTYHKNDSSLDNYSLHFGTKADLKYIGLLPPELLKSPTTHPIRTYDPSKLYLMLGHGGGDKRMERKGIAYVRDNLEKVATMFLHCLLVEVVRVPILLEWSLLQNTGTPGDMRVSLPMLDDIDTFLDFVCDLMTFNKFKTMRNIIQTQYEVHEGFVSTVSFSRAIKFFVKEVEQWLRGMTKQVSLWHTDPSGPDVFSNCVATLSQLLTLEGCLGPWGAKEKMHFFCQHILMNVNELIDDWPFGKPSEAVFGYGGRFGVRRLIRGMELPMSSMQEVLGVQLDHVRTNSDQELAMVGLERGPAGEVFISINKRPLCVLEPEHWGCLHMITSERGAGGSRGTGVSYAVTAPHCHPVRHANFRSSIANASIKEYKAKVESEFHKRRTEEVEETEGGRTDNHVSLRPSLMETEPDDARGAVITQEEESGTTGSMK
jgi:hypothetical protein